MIPDSLNPYWQDLLGAFDFIQIHSSGECIANETSGFDTFLLPNAGLISIEGADSVTFLQGQLTADCQTLGDGDSVFAAHCNPKGRVISNFFLHRVSAEQFILFLPADNIDNALTALRKYAVFSKVTLDDCSEHYLVVGEQGFALEQLNHRIIIAENLSLALINAQSEDQRSATIAQLSNRNVGGSLNWQALLMSMGYPLVQANDSGEHIAQMLNMDLLDGVSFTKGCYTGQEVIARLKYKGESKRRCYQFHAPLSLSESTPCNSAETDPFELPVQTGDSLYASANDGQALSIGQIVNLTLIDNQLHGLAVVKCAAIEPDNNGTPCQIHWVDKTGEMVILNGTISPNLPPYAINN